MKRNLLVIAASASAAIVGDANAQSSVVLYGLLDSGIEYVNHADPAGGRTYRVTSGGMNTSRFGIRGSEDLGGGLKAIFQLESGIFLDTGTTDGVLWKRQANVGFQGDFGRVVFGRSFTTTYDFMLPFDPMGYAPQYSWATTGNGTAVSKYGMTTAFDNIVKYQGQFGGFKIGASYGVGEVAGSGSENAKYILGAGYSRGPFSIAATVDRINGITLPATGQRNVISTVHVGAAYDIRLDTSLKFGFRRYKLDSAVANTPDVRADMYWGGVNFQATDVIGITGVIYHQNVRNIPSGTDADPTMYVLRGRYALSKRTDLYAVTAYAKARNDQLVGLTRDSTADGGVTGFATSQTGVMLGMQHRF